MTTRSIYFISDSTGITAETVGYSLLSHFDGLEFNETVMSFIDTETKARNAVDRIARDARSSGLQPIIVETIIDPKVRAVIHASDAHVVDVISTFLSPLENLLGQPSNIRIGRPQVSAHQGRYQRRIDAMQFALENDDGRRTQHYDQADIILVGVSRSGKTPTSIYLALQANVYAANYPLTMDDFDHPKLPPVLQSHRDKLYGLTIAPRRLHQIRHGRKADSDYASLRQCEDEVRMTEALFRRFGIPFIDTTQLSIEEISTRILVDKRLRERVRN
ncbi:phosphoenolpyruvate synthase regulatory protein [Saccharospirillum sp. MSK14-1]|uniref:posphoenolpyruvate synthetase regulatory kinase/phosphorylase PpsR n=1 Tax=Saccharospirillum sp. MSK14-1 TaxID=1897632 RepID=UPI000D49A810|nr:pyruvate, water dikinase regulatory protein [Saccharospirillum sp. MSK14-1]PTY36254.1 phosphoenolpyruvate synthase regulatory protein [Saccharospirillum sp. MSK14-1]